MTNKWLDKLEHNEPQNGKTLLPELRTQSNKKQSFKTYEGKIQDVLKHNPDIEQKRKINQKEAMRQRAEDLRPYRDFAKETGFDFTWAHVLDELDINDYGLLRQIGYEILRQQITTLGLASYYEARNGWVPDYQLIKARSALIKFLMSGKDLPDKPLFLKNV